MARSSAQKRPDDDSAERTTTGDARRPVPSIVLILTGIVLIVARLAR